MKVFFALITFLIFCCYQCTSFEVEVKYYIVKPDIYACSIKNEELVTSKDNREITSLKGEHLPGKSVDDVRQVYGTDKIMKFFARGLGKYFKNTENVGFWWAELQEINKEDFKEFGGSLKELALSWNKIERLEANLFEYVPNLRLIELSKNKIKFIADGAFNGLEKLETLRLWANPCTGSDDNAELDRADVLKLIEDVKPKCNRG